MNSSSPRLRSLFLIAAASASLLGNAVPALASYLHSDVSIETYTDFAQNRGRYQVGNTSALLRYLNTGGVLIPYTNTDDPEYYPTIYYMPNFSSQTDHGFSAGIGYNFIATVQHIGTATATTFSGRNVGSENAIVYTGIEYADTGYRIVNGGMSYTSETDSDFQWVPTSDSGHADYKITRLSKIVTDTEMSDVYTETVSAGTLLYRSASGVHYTVSHDGVATTLCANDSTYSVGGVVQAGSVTSGVAGTSAIKISATVNFSESGIPWSWSSLSTSDLPSSSAAGDSGSPVWVQTTVNGEVVYQYLGATCESVGITQSNIYSAGSWTNETMAQFDKKIATGTEAVYIGAVSNTGETKSGSAYGKTDGTYASYEVGTTLDYGIVSGGTGGNVNFIGMKQGTDTWKSLSAVKNNDNWYAYQNLSDTSTLTTGYLNVEKSTTANASDDYLNLYYSENLVFEAGTQESTIYVNDADVDLGIGYVRFSAGEQSSASFNLKSDNGYQLHSAGYVIDENVSVYVHLKNSSTNNYTREWRKIGDGDLHLVGTFDDYNGNDVLLNLGGNGKTYLEYELSSGWNYAAYNVLANTGATVVIKDIRQIARDFTFGNGGGVLDMNGNSMEWKLSHAETEDIYNDGFTINALTEEAIITNTNSETATLTYAESGSTTFKGSFVDTADSALKIVANAGTDSVWTLNSVFTNFQNAASGLEVASGNVTLAGTNTVHALGSEDGTDADRLVRSDDWHYADAKMNVSVKSAATFQLGTHARLTGNITVADGGKFVMNEGVQTQNEYIEGGYAREDTYQIREFYGLKGNVVLNGKNAAMEVRYSEGTTAENVYDGEISGEGSLLLELADGSLVLSGENSHEGGTTIASGTLVASNASALGLGAVTVQSGGEISVGENITLSSAAQTLTLVVGANQTEALISSDTGAKITVSGDAQVLIDVSALMLSRSVSEETSLKLVSDSALVFNEESTRIGWWDSSSDEWQDAVGYDVAVLSDTGEVFLVIPEPSAFGLLAGLSALALAASRRRRR